MPEIENLLIPILLRSRQPRPANLEGEAALQATLTSIQQKETVPVVSSSSDVAKAVSGKMYQCKKNPAGLHSLRMDFDDSKVATLYQNLFGQDLIWEIGLDGRYRQTADGDAVLGYWEDTSTFHLEIFDIGTQIYLVRFQGDNLRVIAEEADLAIDCQVLP